MIIVQSFRVASVFLAVLAFAVAARGQRWSVQKSGQDTNLRGVNAITSNRAADEVIVWVCGSHGFVLRSTDQGKTWKQLHVAGGETLDFRGIVAFDEKTAYLMSAGAGRNSRIYKTIDGGTTWTQQYTDSREAFFLDALACISEKKCYALSDPVDGKFLVLSTKDGEHWHPLPGDKMPAALPKEGAFAASNSSLAIYDQRVLYFGTGGPAARVFHSDDLGQSWTVTETPILHGNASSGIF